MTTVAILPIKSFGEAKQRLSHEFDAPTRRALAEAMFSDVLVALRRAPSIDETVVVTADNGAQRIAGGYGATVLDDDDRGHNVAALNGIRARADVGSGPHAARPRRLPDARPEGARGAARAPGARAGRR